MLMTALGHKKNNVQKIKSDFFQDRFYYLKAHADYFTVRTALS